MDVATTKTIRLSVDCDRELVGTLGSPSGFTTIKVKLLCSDNGSYVASQALLSLKVDSLYFWECIYAETMALTALEFSPTKAKRRNDFLEHSLSP